MKSWLCVKENLDDHFTLGKIYVTDDNGYKLTNDKGFTFEHYTANDFSDNLKEITNTEKCYHNSNHLFYN